MSCYTVRNGGELYGSEFFRDVTPELMVSLETVDTVTDNDNPNIEKLVDDELLNVLG